VDRARDQCGGRALAADAHQLDVESLFLEIPLLQRDEHGREGGVDHRHGDLDLLGGGVAGEKKRGGKDRGFHAIHFTRRAPSPTIGA
jgi:hypothetical protein